MIKIARFLLAFKVPLLGLLSKNLQGELQFARRASEKNRREVKAEDSGGFFGFDPLRFTDSNLGFSA